jgi:radical SAM-linked protein
MQRLRITYCVSGPARYSSHLDRTRLWERTARRAGIRLVYSQGFHPRPRMQMGAALPVGFSSRGELIDLWLEEPRDAQEVQAAFSQALPEGIEILQTGQIPTKDPALPTLVDAAEYEIVVETEEPLDQISIRVGQLLAAASLPRQRRGKSYDLHPLVRQLRASADLAGKVTLETELLAREGATGRPEEVLDQLGLADRFYTVQRVGLLLLPTSHAHPS